MQVDSADPGVHPAMLLRAGDHHGASGAGAVIKAMRGWATEANPFSVDDVSLMRELATAAAQVWCTARIEGGMHAR
jgi:hypothetical protein